MRRLTTLVTALALVATGVGTAAAPAGAAPGDDGPLVTINADGGTSTTDGLRVDYASGNLQVHRRGQAQLWNAGLLPVSGQRDVLSNWITLAVGGTIVGGGFADAAPDEAPFDAYTYTSWDTVTSGGGSSTGSGTITSTMTVEVGGLVYAVDLTIVHDGAGDHAELGYVLTIPEGSTDQVRLGWMGDAYVGGTDEGDQFVEVAEHGAFIGVVGLRVGADDPVKSGVRPADGTTQLTYMTGSWWCPGDNAGISDPYPDCPSGVGQMAVNADLPDTADPDTLDNNGFAYRFPAASTPGTYAYAVDHVYTTQAPPPSLSVALDPDGGVAGRDVLVTYALDSPAPTADASTGLGFEHTLPTGLTALEVTSNTCGSGVAGTGTGASVVLSGGVVPAGDGTTAGSCQLVVRTRAATEGSYVFAEAQTTVGVVSAVTGTLVVVPAPPGSFAGLEPVRLADTRPGEPIAADTVRAFTVTDVGGVPTDASAVVLNVTATEGTAPGYLSVFPCGDTRPFVSSVNFQANQDMPNAVTVGVGTDGQICIYSTTQAHVIIDAFAYYAPSADAMITGVEPARLADTRPGEPIAADTVRAFTVTDVGGVPTDASAVVLNVTATEGTAPGYLSVFPCGDTRPFVSSVNFQANQDMPNAVTVGVGTDGQICIYSTTQAHVIIDVFAYYATSSGARVLPLEPARLADTRPGEPIAADTVRAFTVTDVGGVPTDASAVVLNVTATEGTAPGYLSVFPCGDTRPFVSSVNFQANQDMPNAVTVGVGTDGQICIYSTTQAHVIIDAFAYATAVVPSGG